MTLNIIDHILDIPGGKVNTVDINPITGYNPSYVIEYPDANTIIIKETYQERTVQQTVTLNDEGLVTAISAWIEVD